MGKNIVVLATKNKGKFREVKNFLKEFPLELISSRDLGFVDKIEEDGCSFKENVYKKAKSIAVFSKFPVIADDSGLVVSVLDGRPGVYSARYFDAKVSDLERCSKLLEELVDSQDRRAFFKCVISIVTPNGMALFYEGFCKGEITTKIIGIDGFGYDPIFLCDGCSKTFAEMNIDEKGLVSHRGNTLNMLKKDKERFLSLMSFSD